MVQIIMICNEACTRREIGRITSEGDGNGNISEWKECWPKRWEMAGVAMQLLKAPWMEFPQREYSCVFHCRSIQLSTLLRLFLYLYLYIYKCLCLCVWKQCWQQCWKCLVWLGSWQRTCGWNSFNGNTFCGLLFFCFVYHW